MQVRTAKCIAAGASVLAFAVAISAAYDRNMLLAVTNFSGTLFFVFLYENPRILLCRNMAELEQVMHSVSDRFLLWNAIAIGIFGVALEVLSR
jgi:hypothetical protein